MNYIEVNIGDELIENFLKKATGLENVTVEFEENLMRIVFTNKVMGIMKIPVPVVLRFVRGQQSKNDPVVLEIDMNKLLLKFLQNHNGKAIKIKNNLLEVYPHLIFQTLKNFLVSEVSFSREGYISIKLIPENFNISEETQHDTL